MSLTLSGKLFAASAAFLSLLLSGCIAASYHGESYPATDSIRVLPRNSAVLQNYRIIGTGQASGEFSGVTDGDLQNKLCQLGQQHGAEALVVTGTRIVSSGKAVNDETENFITATDAPDQVMTESAFSEDISADPGNAGTVFTRIMYADYLRKK